MDTTSSAAGVTVPEQPLGPVHGLRDAKVRETDRLPERLENGSLIGPFTWAAPGALLFEIPGVARYLVRDGRSVDVAVVPGADRAAADLFLQSAARGALIHQRRELPLAATTLLSPGFQCVALCAPSAHGKSTLAAELCRRGWKLLSENVTRVSFNGSAPIAWPSDDRLQLWRDACERFGIGWPTLAKARAGLEKYLVPVDAATSPAALAAVVRLRIGDQPGWVEFGAGDRADFLTSSTFRPRWIRPMGIAPAHTRVLFEIAGRIRAFGLEGARRVDIARLADTLAEALR